MEVLGCYWGCIITKTRAPIGLSSSSTFLPAAPLCRHARHFALCGVRYSAAPIGGVRPVLRDSGPAFGPDLDVGSPGGGKARGRPGGRLGAWNAFSHPTSRP